MRSYAAVEGNGPLADLGRFFPSEQNWNGYALGNPCHSTPILLAVLLGIAAWQVVRTIRGVYDDNPAREAAWAGLALAGWAIGLAYFATYAGGMFLNYYPPLLWLGLPAIAWIAEGAKSNFGRAAFLLLALNLVAHMGWTIQYGTSPYAAVLRSLPKELRVTAAEQTDLASVRELLDDRAVEAVPIMGETQMLYAHGIYTSPNMYWCLREGLNLPAELARVQAAIRWRRLALTRSDYLEHLGVPELSDGKLLYRGPFLTLIEVAGDGEHAP
jgi:hypothetical protein